MIRVAWIIISWLACLTVAVQAHQAMDGPISVAERLERIEKLARIEERLASRKVHARPVF